MEAEKKKVIEEIVDARIQKFAAQISKEHIKKACNPDGVINRKRNNVFIRELGDEFIFYSAFTRSFDSSFGHVLEDIGSGIAKMNFDIIDKIDSYILPAQEDKIKELIGSYTTDAQNKIVPEISHYDTFTWVVPKNLTSFMRVHETDHCFYDQDEDAYYIIELKAGGDLDVKKAPAEKRELLYEYFMLRNKFPGKNIRLRFATAYNKFGEGNLWNQHIVLSCFASDEVIVGKDYWNFICKDDDGFKVVMDQYQKSSDYIRKALEDIKHAYI